MGAQYQFHLTIVIVRTQTVMIFTTSNGIRVNGTFIGTTLFYKDSLFSLMGLFEVFPFVTCVTLESLKSKKYVGVTYMWNFGFEIRASMIQRDESYIFHYV